MAERIDIDVSQALADIAKLKGGIADLKTQIGQVDKAAEQAFDEGFATGMVDALNDLQKEYNDLKRSADVLKTALKSATDPALIKLYAQNIAVLESGMKRLETSGKAAGVNLRAAFDKDPLTEMVGSINGLINKYGQLKKDAYVLKSALAQATDPAQVKKYTAGIAELEKEMEGLEKTGKAAGVNLKEVNKSADTGKQVFENFFGAFTKATLIIAAIEAVVKFANYAVGLSEQISTAKKSFEGFTGSAVEADQIVNQLIATGQKNFIPTDDILKAGKGLLAFGENADNLDAVLTRLADVSAATGKNFNELVTIYGKARTSGVLYAEDINQLVDAGIPIIQEFAKQMGVSESEIKKLASEGKISFEELQLAMFNLTTENGKFAEQAQNNAYTISGAWNKLLADIQPATEKIGGFFKDFTLGFVFIAQDMVAGIKGAFGNAVEEIKNLNEEGKDEMYASLRAEQEVINTRAKLEKEAADARKKRNQAAVANAAKLAKERHQAEKELQKLQIDSLKEGEAKELAIEQLRYKELIAQLKKYHIDTTEATEQHEKNKQGIELKYALQRIADEQALLDLRKAQAEYEAAQAGVDAEKKKKALEEIRAVRESEIDLTEAQQANLIKVLEAGGASKEAIAELELKFDKEVQAQRLQNNIDFQKGLLAVYAGGDAATIKLIENQIALLETQLAGIKLPEPKEPKDKPGDQGKRGIFDLLGIDLGLSDEQFAELEKGFENIKSIVSDFSAAQVEAADQAVEAAQKQIQAAQSVVDEQKRLSELGFANNLTDAQKNLEAAKAQEAKALEQRKKAAKQQAALDTAAQVSSLITASAQTLKTFNGPLLPVGIALIALMFGAFFAAKARAAQAAKFKHGGSGRVDGDSIIVGASHDTGGVGIEAEGGEFFGTDGKRFGIVNKRMTSKHFDLLQAINKDDKGKMREALAKLAPTMDRGAALGAIGEGSGSLVIMGRNQTDAKAREYLKDIRDNSREKRTIEGGYSVQRKGNHTRKTRMR
jgi:tape measure domain-containing protein